jgi:hypothetical protein
MAFTMGPSAEHVDAVPEDRRFCANASYNQQVTAILKSQRQCECNRR